MKENSILKVRGISGLTLHELQDEIGRGGKFVTYSYCLSFFVTSFRKGTDIYFLKNGESAFIRSLPWTITTLLLGWWALPSGFQYTCTSLLTNLAGGRNLTEEVMAKIFINSGGPAFEFEEEYCGNYKLDKIKLTI